MSVSFRALHAVLVVAVLATSVFEVGLAIHLYGNEYAALSYARVLPAVLCGSYALGQSLLLVKGRGTLAASALFYPLCILLALASSFVANGYGKHWAPSDATDALYANFVGFGGVAILALVS